MQTWKYALLIAGEEFDFKRITWREELVKINDASRVANNGGINTGFNSEATDLAMFVAECEGLADATDNFDFLAQFDGGDFGDDTYDDVAWAVFYDGVAVAAGTGFGVRETSGGGSIPGEATYRFVLTSRNSYTIF